MSKLSEGKPVETKVTEWLSKMGYEFRSVENLKKYNCLQTNAVIEPILVEKVMVFNGIAESDIKQQKIAILKRLKIEGDAEFAVEGIRLKIEKINTIFDLQR